MTRKLKVHEMSGDHEEVAFTPANENSVPVDAFFATARVFHPDQGRTTKPNVVFDRNRSA